MKIQDINTERLVLREIKESDAQQLVKWRSDPEVYKYFTIPRTLTVEEHLNWYRNSYVSDANRIDLIALERVEQNAVGVFGIKKKIGGSCVEISYLVDPQYQSRGYAREAMIALMCFAKERWGCETAMAEIHKNNISSIEFAKRLGFSEIKIELDFVVMNTKLCNL